MEKEQILELNEMEQEQILELNKQIRELLETLKILKQRQLTDDKSIYMNAQNNKYTDDLGKQILKIENEIIVLYNKITELFLKKLKSLEKQRDSYRKSSPANSHPIAEEITTINDIKKEIIRIRSYILKWYLTQFSEQHEGPVQNYLGDEFKWAFFRHNPEILAIYPINESQKGRITVISHGFFRYKYGDNEAKLLSSQFSRDTLGKEPPYSVSHDYDLVPSLEEEQNITVTAKDIADLYVNHQEVSGENVRLLEIIRSTYGEKQHFFVLSPVSPWQLEDKDIQQFFSEVYCSPEYMQIVTDHGVCHYAGAIRKDKNNSTIFIHLNDQTMDAIRFAKKYPGVLLTSHSVPEKEALTTLTLEKIVLRIAKESLEKQKGEER